MTTCAIGKYDSSVKQRQQPDGITFL